MLTPMQASLWAKSTAMHELFARMREDTGVLTLDEILRHPWRSRPYGHGQDPDVEECNPRRRSESRPLRSPVPVLFWVERVADRQCLWVGESRHMGRRVRDLARQLGWPRDLCVGWETHYKAEVRRQRRKEIREQLKPRLSMR